MTADMSAVEALADEWLRPGQSGPKQYESITRHDCGNALRKAIAQDRGAGQPDGRPSESLLYAIREPIDLAGIIEVSVPGDLPGWRYRYSEDIARAIIAAGWAGPERVRIHEDAARHYRDLWMRATGAADALAAAEARAERERDEAEEREQDAAWARTRAFNTLDRVQALADEWESSELHDEPFFGRKLRAALYDDKE